jgi:precorrin-6A/cobalt-precorrin-6A reductase
VNWPGAVVADPALLILGGTTLARRLAEAASGLDIAVIYSLAGRTEAKTIPGVKSRSGGFGGAEALAAYLRNETIRAVVDATHAYAARITANAEAACQISNTPLLRLQEAPWEVAPGDRWINAVSIGQARDAACDIASRVFLTTGRQSMDPFAGDSRCWWLARVIAPGADLPALANGRYLYARGPFSLADELKLLRRHDISALISKNAGGGATHAKIAAARQLGLPVIMIARPKAGDAPLVATVGRAMDWLRARMG